MDSFTLIQYICLFGLSLIFSVMSQTRGTAITYLLSGVCWISLGLVNYTFNPLASLSLVLSYIFVIIGVIFLMNTFKIVGEAVMDRKERNLGL